MANNCAPSRQTPGTNLPGWPLSSKSSPVAIISQPRGKLSKGAYVSMVTIKIKKKKLKKKSTKQNLKIKPTDDVHKRTHLVMHSWLLSGVEHSLASSVPGEAAAQPVCHGAVPLEQRLHCSPSLPILVFQSTGAVAA